MSKYWLRLNECDHTFEYVENRPLHQKLIQRAGTLVVIAILYPLVKINDFISNTKQNKLEKTLQN